MKVMLTKTGGVMCADTTNATPIGDTTNLFMGLVRYLNDHHDVRVFGQVRGNPGVPVAQPDVSGLDEFDTPETVKARYDAAVDKITHDGWQPDACVDIAGQQCTSSWVGNPRCTGVQQRGIKYVAPSLYAMERLKTPRICLVHDPRAYPINHEMHYWDWCRPRAVLTLHETSVHVFKSLDKTATAYRTYSRGGPWWSYGLKPYAKKDNRPQPGLCIAHGHFADGRLNRRGVRHQPWGALLNGYDGPDIEIVGKDWDEFSLPPACEWLGTVPPGECIVRLRTAKCGPIVPIDDRFTTSKLRQYVLNGCLPLPYGRGEEVLTWDHRGEFCALDSDCRVTSARELEDAVRRACEDEDWRQARIKQMLKLTEPDFSTLEKAMRLELKGYEL